MPRFDRGLPSPPDVPTLPARDGVGLYELGGGFIWVRGIGTVAPLKSYWELWGMLLLAPNPNIFDLI
jgi:hypothetical protein